MGRYGDGVNESFLLEHIYRHAGGTAGTAATPATAADGGRGVLIPPGDDMGGVVVGGSTVLVTVDQLVEGVHFTPQTTLERVGRKAITRNLSDVAAMAAKPTAAVAAALLSRAMPDAEATRLVDAMREVSASFEAPLIGGDIAAHDGPMVLTVTLLAEPAGIEPVRRSTARVGDELWVTGQLGGSLLEAEDGRVHHLDFEPRIAVARRLASDAATRPTAMIDLSDGLGRDLARVCAASDVSAVIELEALPVRGVAAHRASRDGIEPWRAAVGDGEDYELLMAMPPGVELPPIEGVTLTRIGRIVPRGETAVTWRQGGAAVRLDPAALGWEHGG